MRPTSECPLPEAPLDNADRQPANLVLNRSFQALLQICNTYRPLICDLSYRGRSATPYSKTKTLTHEPRNPSVQSARTNTAGWLAKGSATSRGQILISLYFVRYLTFNSFFGFLSSPHRTSRQDPPPRTNYLPTLWAEFAVENSDKGIGKTQWLTPFP